MSRAERLLDLLHALRRHRRPCERQGAGGGDRRQHPHAVSRYRQSSGRRARRSRENRVSATCCGPGSCCLRSCSRWKRSKRWSSARDGWPNGPTNDCAMRHEARWRGSRTCCRRRCAMISTLPALLIGPGATIPADGVDPALLRQGDPHRAKAPSRLSRRYRDPLRANGLAFRLGVLRLGSRVARMVRAAPGTSAIFAPIGSSRPS